MSTNYPYVGSLPLIPVADLQNLVSDANRNGGTANGATSANGVAGSAAGPGAAAGFGGPGGLGKRAGTKVLVDLGSAAYATVMAAGPLSSDLWRIVDGTTAYTPVNIVNPGGGGAWTLTTATYAAGVLTSSGAAAINATQTVVLKAGRYRLAGTVGRRVSTVWPVLKITQVTGTVVLATLAYSTAKLDAASVLVDTLSDTFVLPQDGSVKFDLNVQDVSGNQTGATFISFILQANG